jgi:Protein of unknown function (DUF3224)
VLSRGAPQLSVTVIPDSGTDALASISGRLSIRVADGKHFHEFDYSV